jgi:hypothetical protein
MFHEHGIITARGIKSFRSTYNGVGIADTGQTLVESNGQGNLITEGFSNPLSFLNIAAGQSTVPKNDYRPLGKKVKIKSMHNRIGSSRLRLSAGMRYEQFLVPGIHNIVAVTNLP